MLLVLPSLPSKKPILESTPSLPCWPPSSICRARGRTWSPALISSSVELALGALQACRELGIGIPDALALATFDDAYFAELLDPPLTAVAYDPSDVGAQAASLLVEAIRDEGARPRRVTIPVTLVTRRSCGCER